MKKTVQIDEVPSDSAVPLSARNQSSMPVIPDTTFFAKLWNLAYDSLFLWGLGLLTTIIVLRVTTADRFALMVAKPLTGIAWLFIAAAIRKTNFFERAGPNQRAIGEVLLSAVVILVLVAGWYYGPWERMPRLYTTGFSQYTPQGSPASVNFDVENKSDDDAFAMNMDGRARLVPFNGSLRSPQDYFSMDDRVANEIFAELENSPVLKNLPFKNGVSAGGKVVYTLQTDHPLTQDDIRMHAEGRLIVAAAGRIKYKDSHGCEYQSEFCGFFGKAEWLFAHCHGGHFEQAVRLNTKCEAN